MGASISGSLEAPRPGAGRGLATTTTNPSCGAGGGGATPRHSPNESGVGYRVHKLQLNREQRRQFSELYWRLVDRDPSLPACCFIYYGSWEVVDSEAEKRRKKRKKWRRAAYYLLVKMLKDGRRVHGSEGSPVVLDLTRAELRIPCAGIRVKLQPSVIKAMEEDLGLRPKPSFVFQLCSDGRARIIAFREVHPASGVKRIISLDLNSSYGLAALVIDFDDGGRVARVVPRRWQPPNTTLHEAVVAALQSASKKGAPSAVLERLPPELKEKVEKVLERFGTLTTERASALARKVKRSIRKLHKVWVEEILNDLRRLVREAGGQCLIMLDPPDGESLRGTPLQRTLLSVPDRIENLARYEGAVFKEVRSSGKKCPLCNSPCVEIAHRYFSCSNCGVVADRDYSSCFRAAAERFPQLKEWLREHPKALAPNFFNPTNLSRRTSGREEAHALRPLSRDTPRGGSRGPARSTRG
ncbi:MAG: hypothetical protein QXJ21_07060 [Thermofilum sp.]